MPRLPRVTAPELIRAFERAGYRVVRIRGSHHVLRNAEGKRVTIQRHATRTLPPGTVANILREAGISRDELIAMLEE